MFVKKLTQLYKPCYNIRRILSSLGRQGRDYTGRPVVKAVKADYIQEGINYIN